MLYNSFPGKSKISRLIWLLCRVILKTARREAGDCLKVVLVHFEAPRPCYPHPPTIIRGTGPGGGGCLGLTSHPNVFISLEHFC